ncbi:MAG: cyclic nucleotide-binding domain-containing protein [Deltaproteobacteria bacterium]|nr:cyclic nucleotide-binding domain-containing protein [Deltaproteobacteria bacterium]
MIELLWRAVPGVRRTERDRFLFFFVLAGLLSTSATLGLAGSEALFLAGLGPEHLPMAFILASAATLVSSILYAMVVGRARNDRLFVVMLLATAATLVVNYRLLGDGSPVVLIVLFSTFYVTQAVFISLHFWTFATDFFDTLASKRLFPLFAVGASTGGMLGGILAVGISRLYSGESLVLVWAVALLATALHIRLARSRLLRWTPVGAAEADESSVQGLTGALRYVTRSRMASWLVLSVVGMVFSLTLMQYVYLDVFSREFESVEALATFFGLYLAITNGIEILVGNALTPWLIRRFGVAQANLAHPLLTILTFVALAVDPRLWVAVAARANRELLENALAGPVRALSYNALPRRFRGRTRALLEGVVFFAAMSIAGAALIGLGDQISTTWLALVGGLAAILYAGANLAVRREYLKSLVDELRHGRVDLGTVALELGSRELSGLAKLWDETIDEEHGRITLALLELADPLARRGFGEHVRRHVHHPDPRVRRACLEALAGHGDPELDALLAAGLDDPDAQTRRCAAALVGQLSTRSGALAERLRAGLEDPDVVVRAEAALHLGPEGTQRLRSMLRDPDSNAAIAALERAPRALLEVVSERIDAPEPAVRAAVIECFTRLEDRDHLPVERLVADLHDPDAGVRRAAAAALAERRDDSAIHSLAAALDDESRLVRTEAQTALATLGDAGVLAAAPLCRGSRTWTVDAALGTVGAAGGAVAQALLRQCYADRVQEAWWTQLAIRCCGEDDGLDSKFLRAALENAHTRARFLALRILELIEDPAVVRSVARALDRAPSRTRADALEVLSNLGDRDASHRFALLLEEHPLEDKLPALAGFVSVPSDLDSVLREAARSADRWLQLAAARYRDGAPEPGDEHEEEGQIMERLLALQRVPLFTHLSLEQLEVINRLLQEVHFLAGEVIVREGEPGGDLYILVEGEVTYYKSWRSVGEQKLSSMQPVGYFGEMSVLDDEPRSVTVIASRDARLLVLAGERFKELILQAPEISFEVFPVLMRRIREAEAQLTDLKGGT